MRTNDFATDLAYSHSQEDAPWWDEVYRKGFGNSMLSHHRHSQDGWHQRAGVDRTIVLRDSKTLRVDEKVRRRAWGDVLLETESKFYGPNVRKNVPGWAVKDALCDYIAYAFAETGICYLLPFHAMQSALRTNWTEWNTKADAKTNGFTFVIAKNSNYSTRSIAVPTDILLAAVTRTMTITFSTTRKEAPF